MNDFYRGRGGLKFLVVIGAVWGTLSAATYVMQCVSSEWVYIPAIVLGAGALIAVLLFKLIGPLS